MPELTLGGVPINFPFEPYDVQISFMEKVIQCLQQGQNGLLESPTGTGKTLCLLCSALGWLGVKKALRQAESLGAVHQLNDGDTVFGLHSTLHSAAGSAHSSSVWGVPKIIYASRTHSQLTQVIKELKKTSYTHVKVSVLGSRDQMCIHPDISTMNNNTSKVHFCHVKINTRSCQFHTNVDAAKENAVIKDGGILDIEDLVKVGQKLKCCPYYVAKSLKDTADIVFMPYNYLLDPKMRSAQGIDLLNNIVILDEAHNVEKMCEESASLQIRSSDVALAIADVTQIMQEFATIMSSDSDTTETSANLDFSADDLCILKTMFLQLEKEIDEINVDQNGSTFPGSFMFELLERVELTSGKSLVVLDLLEKAIKYLSTTNSSPYQRKGVGLQKFQDLMKVVFCGNAQNHIYMKKLMKCYKVHVTLEEVNKKDSWMQTFRNVNKNGKVINYWCFSPGFGMQRLLDQGVRCIILTSGTLSPLKPLITELSIPISVTLENPHVIQPSQICVGIIEKGPDNVTLDSSFRNRGNQEYVMSLGRTILNLSRLVPHGLLVFFPSYTIMRNCQEAWQNDGIWTRICNCKPIFAEPRHKDGLVSAISEYYAKIMDPGVKGACFMAVTRGKVSEGLDFSDMNGRGVIVTGIPFPPCMDPRVVLKRAYLDELMRERADNLSGQSWYQLEASRAVNQAIGRVIRHAKDYGAILLCDERFSRYSFRSQLSSWIQPHIKVLKNFGQVTRVVKDFFTLAERTLPQPKVMLDVRLEGGSVAKSVISVPASFDTSARYVNNRVPSDQPASTSALSSVPDWSADEYRSANLQTKAVSSSDSISGLFSALDRPTQVIDFNDAGHVVSRHANVETNVPAAKKRKLKLVSLDRLNPNCALSLGHEPTEAARTDPVRIASVVGYLNEVKQSLDSPSYRKFRTAVKNYTTGSNFEECIAVLEEVFLRSFKLPSLLRGFHKFIKPQHKQSFDAFCMSLKDS